VAIDLSKFKGVLPYDSQLYGIYQPLLGWRSSLQVGRLDSGLTWTRRAYLWTVAQSFSPEFEIRTAAPDAAKFELGVAEPSDTGSPSSTSGIDGLLMQHVMTTVEAAGGSPAAWQEFPSRTYLVKALVEIQESIQREFHERLWQSSSRRPAICRFLRFHGRAEPRLTRSRRRELLASILQRESVTAGVLAQLNETNSPNQLAMMLAPTAHATFDLAPLVIQLDPAESDMTAATLSPIGVVHLFRQYFFELATFLGPPVQHVWLSPGGTVELIEVSTRRSLVEKTIEQSLESIQKAG